MHGGSIKIMHNVVPLFSPKLNWIEHKYFLDNNFSFLNNIKSFSDKLHSSPTGETTNSGAHCIYPICMVQELLVLIDVLQFHSLYHLLILSHSTEWNVVVYRNV
jgi:hypothetical protein